MDGLKVYLDESPGKPLQNIWVDIARVPNTSSERLGYPTQKPQALAKRIIEASSDPDDIVLDCFAGCAYVPVAAELSGRRWIACDMSPRAWTVVRRQFHKQQDLRIATEGEYPEAHTGMQPDLGDQRIIRVRGPWDLPERTTDGAQETLGPRNRDPIQFKVRPLETSQEIWDAFVDAWGTACWYCGTQKQRSRRDLQLDHVQPNKKDGTNDDCWNRALACADCNGDKRRVRSPEETIELAWQKGRIATEALKNEQMEVFERRRGWAEDRYECIKSLEGN